MYMDCFETAVLCLLIHGWYFCCFSFSEQDQTRPHYPFLGSWIGSPPPVSFEQFVVMLIETGKILGIPTMVQFFFLRGRVGNGEIRPKF